jgi:hypothetical protein
MEGHIHTDHSGSNLYAVINAILFSVAWVLNIIVNTVDLNKVYDWSFKGLSLLSVLLIVVINWSKAWAILTGKEKKE